MGGLIPVPPRRLRPTKPPIRIEGRLRRRDNRPMTAPVEFIRPAGDLPTALASAVAGLADRPTTGAPPSPGAAPAVYLADAAWSDLLAAELRADTAAVVVAWGQAPAVAVPAFSIPAKAEADVVQAIVDAAVQTAVGRAEALAMNITDRDSIQQVITILSTRHGRIDAVVKVASNAVPGNRSLVFDNGDRSPVIVTAGGTFSINTGPHTCADSCIRVIFARCASNWSRRCPRLTTCRRSTPSKD